MIVNNQVSHEAEYIGDIQENRVGIDKANIDFITTLLTSNLYSKPLDSFLRETISNAYDSHVEAGSNEYILLLIEDLGGSQFNISIRDYGTGLSPERFDQIYRFIGSSTKRESNDYIGMFGIGRMSCLAVTNVANITSYYNGTMYSYIMYKNGTGINIDKVSETKGDYKNGLEVSIKANVDCTQWEEAINRLCLFDKLHIVYKGEGKSWRSENVANTIRNFNARTVVKHKTFCKCNLLPTYHNYYRVGNVIYDIGSHNPLSLDSGIIIDLPLGEIDITPNRENLQFTPLTLNTIEKSVEKVKEEFTSMVQNIVTGDTTLSALYINLCDKSYFFVKDSDIEIRISKDDVNAIKYDFTIDGEKAPLGIIALLNSLKYYDIPKDLISRRINKSNYRNYGSCNFKDVLLGNEELFFKGDKVTKNVTLHYFTSNSRKATVCTYEAEESLKKFLFNIVKAKTNDELSSYDDTHIESIVDFFLKHSNIKVISNKAVPNSYVEWFNDTYVSKKVKADEGISVRLYTSYNSYRQTHLKDIKGRGIIIYSQHTKDDNILKNIAGFTEFMEGVVAVITVKADVIPMLRNNPKFVSVEHFLYIKTKSLVKLLTAYKLRKYFRGLELKLSTEDYTFRAHQLPLHEDFSRQYASSLTVLNRYSSDNDTLRALVDYYDRKGWLNKGDIDYYTLSDKELEAIKLSIEIKKNKYDILNMLLIRKVGRLPRIGLTLPENPSHILELIHKEKKQ